MPVLIRRLELVVTGLVMLPLLAACGGGRHTCDNTQEPYLTARSGGPLRIPDGLTKPDASAALAIPDVKATGESSGSSCLAEPPSYFRSAGTVARSPEEVVASWAQAWSHREADAVVELYSSSFTPPTDAAGGTPWLEQRREQVATGPVPDSMVEKLKIEQDGPDRRIATFIQKFGTNTLRRELTLVRESSSWRIVSERVVEVQ
jgi:hypothetical protein